MISCRLLLRSLQNSTTKSVRNLSTGNNNNNKVVTEHTKAVAGAVAANPGRVISSSTRIKNIGLALSLFGFIAGVYWYSISRMSVKVSMLHFGVVI